MMKNPYLYALVIDLVKCMHIRSDKVTRFLKPRHKRTSCSMKQRNCRPYWTPSKPFVRKRNPKVFSIQREWQLSFVHIKEYA